jgi:hypothetical protein
MITAICIYRISVYARTCYIATFHITGVQLKIGVLSRSSGYITPQSNASPQSCAYPNATNEWDNEMNDLLAMAREQLEILHGEIFDRNVEHKVIDKCDTLIDILKQIKIKREDMDAIIDVKKMI